MIAFDPFQKLLWIDV